MPDGDMQVSANVKHAEIGAKIIRADGTEEELGVVSEYNAPKNLLARVKDKLTGKD